MVAFGAFAQAYEFYEEMVRRGFECEDLSLDPTVAEVIARVGPQDQNFYGRGAIRVIRMRRAAAEPDKKNDDKRAEVEGGGDPAGAAAKRSGAPDRLGRALL